jgi:hypothetical protein
MLKNGGCPQTNIQLKPMTGHRRVAVGDFGMMNTRVERLAAEKP